MRSELAIFINSHSFSVYNHKYAIFVFGAMHIHYFFIADLKVGR